MLYQSTRGYGERATADEAILRGLAPDGGLYVPAEMAALPAWSELTGCNYQELSLKIIKPFLASFSDRELLESVCAAYNRSSFDHEATTPLRRLTGDLWYLELWHGPTAAFKDIALQLLPRLMRQAMIRNGEEKEIVILTATSGDTGKSALEGFRDIPGIRIIVYYPEKGVSKIQKLQMITQEGANVAVAAVKGNFDDAQNGVKSLFTDFDLVQILARAGKKLSSANSINWGRLLPQIVYYFSAYLELIGKKAIHPGDKINFVVPTGNFGNILAGFYAMQLGLPVKRLICAANRNNVLSDFIASGRYNCRRQLYQTLSPSMDILVSSNLERLLFELSDHDPQSVAAWMQQLKARGEYNVTASVHRQIGTLFWSDYADDRETLSAIADIYSKFNYLIDTHTAVAQSVLDKYRVQEKDLTPAVILSTASPFKFAGSVSKALWGSDAGQNIEELQLLEKLSRETGARIPSGLVDLDQKLVKHKQVIAREAMRDHLLEILGIRN